MKAAVPLLVLLLAGGTGIYFLVSSAEEKPTDAEAAKQAESTDAKATPMQASPAPKAVAKAKKKEVPEKFRLYFPDGTWLPTLNGAKNCKPVEFSARPYSPVVRKEFDAKSKISWYIHADGSRSTTLKSPWKGQMNHVTAVLHPGSHDPDAPMPPVAIERPGEGVIGFLDARTGKPLGKWKGGKRTRQANPQGNAPKTAGEHGGN